MINTLINKDYNQNSNLRILFFCLITFLIVNISNIAFAASDDPIGTQLCAVISILKGNTAKAVGIVALMFVGIGLFMGKINWGVAISTAIGVIVLFGAPTLVGFFAGGSVDATTCATA